MVSRKVRIDDLRKFTFISDPQISPDGTKVAFVHSAINYEKDDYIKHIWMLHVETGERYQFTYGDGKDSNPRWSPDGSKLLFLSTGRESDKKNQLYVMAVSGGEAKLIADLETGVSDPKWAPDSKSVLFTSRVWEPEEPETDVVVIKRMFYKLNGVGLFAGKRVHLFRVEIGEEPIQLTKGEFDIEAACWSPDGEKIAVVTNLEEDADMTHVRHIYTMPSGGGEMRKITGDDHSINAISWSPDGENIAYLGDDFHARGATNTDIWLIPSEGGVPLNVTEGFDYSIGRGIGSDLRVSSQNPSPVWAPCSRILYFLTGKVPNSNVYRVDKETKVVEQVTEEITVDSFSFSEDFNVMAFNAMTSTEPCELYIQEGKVSRKATKFNEETLNDIQIAEPEVYTWRNVYGDEIEGWIIKPPDFNPNKKYPVILQIHGGPLGIYGEGIYHEFQIMASAGYCVIYTNPRGSGGYSERYAATLNGRHGTVDYQDIMDFTRDALSRYGFLDKEKLGITGGSYGGYLTNWIITQTDLFKAAVSCRSTCNRHSHHGYSDYGYKHGESGNMGYPWKDEQKLLAQSPIIYASNVKTPTLLIHSENDLRCTIEQAEEFFTALMELGVPVEMVRFPDENHELSRSGKPKHREERLRHILRWFDKYLK